MRIGAVLLSALLVSGCLGLGGKTPAFLMTLTPAQAPGADAGRAVQAGETMTINTPLVPQALAALRVPVTQGDTAIAYVKDAAWVEPPAKLFQRLLAETVRAKTGRVVLDPRQFAADPGDLVTGSLLAFGIDQRSASAVVIYDATVQSAGSKLVRTRRFEARVPVGEIDAANTGRALNSAANTVAGEVADWLGR